MLTNVMTLNCSARDTTVFTRANLYNLSVRFDFTTAESGNHGHFLRLRKLPNDQVKSAVYARMPQSGSNQGNLC